MTGEIVPIGVGQCGINMLRSHHESMLREHAIGHDGQPLNKSSISYIDDRQEISTFFDENIKGGYMFRGAMLDLDRSSIDSVRNATWARMCNPDCLIGSSNSSANLWATGHYTEGAEMMGNIIDQIRLQAEITDRLDGFFIMSSLGGGTGSGLGTLVQNKILEEYSSRVMCTFSNLSPNADDNVLAPYNNLLGYTRFIDCSTIAALFDNNSMQDILFRSNPSLRYTYQDLNRISQEAISDMTASTRFPGPMRSSLRKIATNLVPFNLLHFISLSHASVSLTGLSGDDRTTAEQAMLHQVFDSKNYSSGVDAKLGKIITLAKMNRGPIPTYSAEQEMAIIKNRNSRMFLNWVANSVTESHTRTSSQADTISCTIATNSTNVAQVCDKVISKFRKMFRKRVYLQHYVGEGMDEMEFTEAEANIAELGSSYTRQEEVHDEPNEDEE